MKVAYLLMTEPDLLITDSGTEKDSYYSKSRVRGHRSQLGGIPMGQVWNNLSTKITINNH